jgi:phosphohistidine phosphatase
MQRTLVMIRHAKSSWANPLQSDFERPLNERGKREAPEMANKLKQAGIAPDLVICSTAKRTRQTAKRICEVLGYDLAHVKWEEKLYHCIPSVFEELLYEVGDKVKTVFIIAHNPGITEFVNHLSPAFSIDNMPTCGIACAHFDSAEWNMFPLVEKEVFLFEHPEKEK